MHFNLVDAVLDRGQDQITTLKQVSMAEEYLGDHFPTFPVLPGVMMIESMTQAARELLGDHTDGSPIVLSRVRALKYGSFVKPGDRMHISVEVLSRQDDGTSECKGRVEIESPAAESERRLACSGKFTMRPVRL